MTDVAPDPTPVVFVTGPAGAGRSTAIAALEDLAYEVIDNLPLSLVGRVLNGPRLPPQTDCGKIFRSLTLI